jgi:hypothetical protein
MVEDHIDGQQYGEYFAPLMIHRRNLLRNEIPLVQFDGEGGACAVLVSRAACWYDVGRLKS